MADVPIDTVYHNSGVAHAEDHGKKVGDALDARLKPEAKHLHGEEAKLAHSLLADGTHHSAAETRAFWNSVNLDKAHADSKYLPKGFTVQGDQGHYHVFDGKKEIYNEDAVNKQAEIDTHLKRGESPYQAFIRQGMNPVEAAAAARDARDGLKKGNGGFKEKEAYSFDKDGRGDWFKSQRDQKAAEKAAQEQAERDKAARDERDKAEQAKLTKQAKELADKAREVEDVKKGLGDAFTNHGNNGWAWPKNFDKASLDKLVKDPSLQGFDKAAIAYMDKHYGEIAGSKKFITQQDAETFMNGERSKIAADTAKEVLAQQALDKRIRGESGHS